ncbi:MAG: NAD-dependent epimerase/dehydratase family protein [Actinomycetes bacterium]
MASMADFWSGRSVVVTGGNGFLGRVVVRLLSEQGAHVAAPTHDAYDLTIPGAPMPC